MHRDPGVQRRRLDVKWNEKADRDPGGQDRSQGHLHRGFAVLPADFLAQVLECVFRTKSAIDSGMKSATESDLISAIPI